MKLERYDKGQFLQLKKIDSALFRADPHIPFLSVNPNNIEQEKAKVLSDPDYNPIFTYDDNKNRLQNVLDLLESVGQQDTLIGEILEKKRKEYILKSKMLFNVGKKKFSDYSVKAYGTTPATIVKKAKLFLDLETEPPKKNINTEQAIDIMKAEMFHYGFTYDVAQKQMSAVVDVNPVKKRFVFKPNEKFSPRYIQQLLIHEIGTHVLRAENGRLQPFKIFLVGFPDYLRTEEGLAVVNEERFGLLNPGRLKKYAARAIAVDMARKKGFSEIYRFLRQHLSDEAAFTITLRAKRGTGDSSRSGGWTKDHLYLDGYFKVIDYLKKGGDIKKLYYGKVSIEYADRIEQIPGLEPPRYLPQNQSFKSLLEFI